MSDGPAERQPAPAVVPPTLPPRLNVLNVSLAVFAVAVLASLPALKGSGRPLNYWENIERFARKCFPPDFSVTGDALVALGETFQISVLATFFAIIFAFPIGLAGSSTFSPRWLVIIVRLGMNMIRTIHSLLWAIIA